MLLGAILYIFLNVFADAAFVALIYNFLFLRDTGKIGRVISEKVKKLEHDIPILK